LPQIAVLKEVACATANGCSDASFSKSATGVKGATCPAFCYRITVSNPGAPNTVPLANITVSDTDLTAAQLADCNTALAVYTAQNPLPPGQSATACVVGPVEHCDDVHNTVTATGASSFDTTQTITATDTADVHVVPISVTCTVTLSSSLDLDNVADNGHVTLPADQQNAPISITVHVHNPSTVPLSVSVTDLPAGLVLCSDDTTPAPAPTPIDVPANGDGTIELGCLLVSCPAGANISITVVGTAVASETAPCIYTTTGAAVTTAPSTCTADVTCAAPASCRVTGGGVLIPGETQTSGCTPATPSITTQAQGPTCNGIQAVKITHGGQLGAPYSQPTCGLPTPVVTTANALTGNPCIRGQWEHVRHYQGKANPQTTVSVDNFHSNTPKGIFDSLQCACLPCCENPSEGTTTDGSLCNPDDKKICGPQPRPAPANAIIFSGIGYISTCDTANQKGKGGRQAVIFRVYIEDRSEPGGNFPGGAKAPADVYCFQAWAITGQIDSTQTIADRNTVAQDNCTFLNTYTQGALPNSTLLGTPIINDCGTLHTGNQQIHPSTAATCTPSL